MFSASRKKFIITISAVIILGLAFAIFALPYLLNLNNYRGFIAENLSEALEQPVSIEDIKLDLLHGLGLNLRKTKIGAGTPEALELDNLLVTLKPLPLIHRELIIDRIILQSPEVFIQRDAQGKLLFPFRKLLLKKSAGRPALKKITIDRIVINQGRLIFTDKFKGKLYSMVADKVHLGLENFKPEQPLGFKIQAELYRPDGKGFIGFFIFDGQIVGLEPQDGSSKPESLENLWIKGEGELKKWNLEQLQPYLATHVPFTGLSGLAEGKLDFQGFPGRDFQLNLRTTAESARLDYPKIFTNPIHVAKGSVNLKLSLIPPRRFNIEINQINLDTGTFQVRGDLRLTDLLGEHRRIYLKAYATPMTVADTHRCIAYAVIPPKVADFMHKSFTSGNFSQLEVKLDGELSQFGSLKKPENGDVIQASGQFHDLKLNLPWEPYYIGQASGRVRLGQGGISFEDMSGNIQGSQIKIGQARLNDIYSGTLLMKLSSEIALNWADPAWGKILPEEIFKTLHPYGKSLLQVELAKNEGRLDVSGEAALDETGYYYQEWLHKAPNRQNKVAYDLHLDDARNLEISKLDYAFGDSSLQLSGKLSGGRIVNLNVSTSNLSLEDLAQLSPNFIKPLSYGTLMADLIVRQPELLKTKVIPAKLSAPADQPVSSTYINIAGAFILKNANLALLRQPLTLVGQSRGKFNLALEPAYTKLEGEFNLDQASYIYSGVLDKPRNYQFLSNQLTLDIGLPKNKGLEINNIVFMLGKDKLQINGNIKDFKTLEADIKTRGKMDNLQQWQQFFKPMLKDKPDTVAGKLDFDLDVKGTLNTPSALDIKGSAEMKDGALKDDTVPYDLQGVDAKFKSSKSNPGWASARGTYDIHLKEGLYKKFTVSDFTAGGKWQRPLPANESTTVGTPSFFESISFDARTATGSYGDYDFTEAAATGNWQKSRLDISRLTFAEFSRPDTPLALKGVKSNWSYKTDTGTTFDLRASGGYYKKLDFNDLIGLGNWHKSVLYLKESSVSLFEGALNVTGQVNMFENANAGYDLTFNAGGINSEKLIKRLSDEKTVITGKIDISGQLSNPGQTPGQFDKLNGQVKLKMTDGNIRRFKTLATIFALTNPISIFRGIPNLDKEGFPYYSIKGDIAVKDGVADTNNLILDSASWRILTLGQTDLANENLDLKVYVQPWRTLDQVVNLLPLIGKILQGEKGSFLDTYFTVQGDLKSPEITARPISTLAENAWGIITRTLSLPWDIIKAIPRKPSPPPPGN